MTNLKISSDTKFDQMMPEGTEIFVFPSTKVTVTKTSMQRFGKRETQIDKRIVSIGQ